MKFAKFLRAQFLTEHLRWLLLKEETCEDGERKILKILKNKLKIEDVTIQRVHKLQTIPK